MNNSIAKTECNLCGGRRHYLVYQRKRQPDEKSQSGYSISEHALVKPTKVVRCLDCGFVWAIQPDVSSDEIRRDYSVMEDNEYLREEAGRRAQARVILARLAKHKQGGRLLDIGCGPGFFLEEARQGGFEVEGLDLSRWSADYARKRFGIRVFEGLLAQAPFEPKSFDVITFNDVIEHIEDPKTFLTQVRRLLKNDGVLYVSTPDIDSFLSRLLQGSWWGINKYHLCYFSRKTLKAL
ncbi:MAG: class I SAM-dependent methyltransferase, partial [Candidatus Omnitrophota bacterium]